MYIVFAYAAEVEFADAVVELPHQAHHVTDLAVTEPKGGRRKTVSDVTVNSVVISCNFSANYEFGIATLVFNNCLKF